MTTYLSFAPDDHAALSNAGRDLNLDRTPLPVLQRLLAQALAAERPALAARIAGLGREELRLLRDHFREHARAAAGHGPTADEIEMLAAAAGPTPFRARFLGPLRRALAQFFRRRHPVLAAKLDRLSDDQFAVLCRQIEARVRRGHSAAD